MSSDGDVWLRPRKRFPFRGDGNIVVLEERFEKSFNGGFPVLLGSARVGIMLILKLFHNSRYISIFPYASQCVVKAAILAEKDIHTPLPNQPREIIYNQWGFHQDYGIGTNPFLEDSADSLYPVGGRVCKANSRFEVWSFPKILGTSFGGVVWCKSESDALRLRKIRDDLPRQNFLYQSLLSTLKSKSKSGYQIWEDYEFSHPGLTKSQIKILSVQLDMWAATYLKMASSYRKAFQKAGNVNYLGEQDLSKLNFGVIPTVIEWKSPIDNKYVRELSRVYYDGNMEHKRVYAYQKLIDTK